MLCLTCFQLKDHHHNFLCARCINNVSRLRLPYPSKQPPALYQYEGHLKDLIWRAKIQGSLSCLACLQDLWLHHETTRTIINNVDVVMPAPSSLWGRLRGRFDIAYTLAISLVQKFNKKLKKPPHTLGWHLKKMAQQKASQRQLPFTSVKIPNRKNSQAWGAKTILLVDDLITTGHTLNILAQALGKTVDQENILTLCLASRHRPTQ